MQVHGAYNDVDHRPVFVGVFFFDHRGSIQGGRYFLVGSLWWPRPGWDGHLYSFFFRLRENVPSGDF